MMAKTLAAKNVSAPPEILRSLQEVLIVRSRFLKLFDQIASAQPEDTKTADKNVTHRHFLNVLGDVFRDLGGLAWIAQERKRSASSSTPKAPESPVTPMQNAFETLDVEEPTVEEADDDEWADWFLPPAPKEPSPTEITPESLPDSNLSFDLDEDILLAIYLFIQDVKEIRHYLMSVWDDCDNGKIHLVTASATTMLLWAVVGYLERDLRARHSELKEYEDIKSALPFSFIATEPHLLYGPYHDLDIYRRYLVADNLKKFATPQEIQDLPWKLNQDSSKLSALGQHLLNTVRHLRDCLHWWPERFGAGHYMKAAVSEIDRFHLSFATVFLLDMTTRISVFGDQHKAVIYRQSEDRRRDLPIPST